MLGIACVLAWVSPRAVAAAADDGVYDDQGHCLLPARRDGPGDLQPEEPEPEDRVGLVATRQLALVAAARGSIERPAEASTSPPAVTQPHSARGPPTR